MDYPELEQFYLQLVKELQEHGVACAVTSGMACVAMGISQATKDCDILCAPTAAPQLLDRLQSTLFENAPCHYRGFISPPLDERWLKGGWTSHFVWKGSGTDAYLDVFGTAPRVAESWEGEVGGRYVSAHVVAEMKKTSRARDWDSATALGTRLLKQGDSRGWLHLFDAQLLSSLIQELDIPSELMSRRPVLRLAAQGDPRLAPALWAEQLFWQELDRVRLDVYENALRPYLACVRETGGKQGDLFAQHEIRVACAEKTLDRSPILTHGIQALVSRAQEKVAQTVRPELLEWLPDGLAGFGALE